MGKETKRAGKQKRDTGRVSDEYRKGCKNETMFSFLLDLHNEKIGNF